MKLTFARLILQDPKIIVADEPTDLMDAETEEEICQLFVKLKAGRTIIICSNRKAVLNIADDAVVL